MAFMKRVDNSVPAGKYKCTFIGTEEIHHDEYGERLKWSFAVDTGPQKGKIVCGFTTTNPTTRNKCGDYLCALVGDSYSDEDEYDPDGYISQKYSVRVVDSSTGRSVVIKDFEKLDEPKPAQPVVIDPSEVEATGQELPF